MKAGELKPATLIALMALLVLAGGFGWYRFMYQPAKEQEALAVQEMQAAQQDVTAKEAQLQQVQSQGTDRKPVSELIISNRAIPRDKSGGEALLEVEQFARKTGVTIIEAAVTADSATAGGGSSAPIDVTMQAHAPYPQLIMFLQQVQEMVDSRGNKVYVRGRLVNVMQLEVSTGESNNGGGSMEDLPKGHLQFSLRLRMFSSDTSGDPHGLNAGADPAAADPNAGAAAPGGATPAPTGGDAAAPADGGGGAPSSSTIPAGES